MVIGEAIDRFTSLRRISIAGGFNQKTRKTSAAPASP